MCALKRWAFVIVSLLLATVSVFMIAEPSQTIEAARHGLDLWARAVVPALLPFFVIAELMIGLGLMHHLGRWLDPLMRPLFNLPGAAGLAVAMGYTSGFPVGAVVTRALQAEGLLTREEATHLVSFTNNSSPLFIIGTIGTGMLGNPAFGYILAASHYASNLTVGWWLGRSRARRPLNFLALHSPAPPPPQSWGAVVGPAVRNSVMNILMIGGFIVLFMVLARCLLSLGLLDAVSALLTRLIPGISPELGFGCTLGLLEITIGSQAVCAAQDAELARLLVVSAVLALSGASVLSQVASIMAEAGLSFSLYVKARLLQIPVSLLLTWLGWHLLGPHASGAFPTAAAIPVARANYLLWAFVLILMLASALFFRPFSSAD